MEEVGTNNYHIGREIQQKLKEQGRTVTWFANAIHCDRSNVYKLFCQPSMDVARLIEISRVLGHNFVQECADRV